MFEYSTMNVLILLSVLICVIVSITCAYIVYRRDPTSLEHKLFAVFFAGTAGFVVFYMFLQSPVLKDFSYFLQILFGAIAVLGLFFFYYNIAHKGKVPKSLYISITISLLIPPILIILIKPYTFVEQWYGFELVIDPWFMTFINTLYPLFIFYSVIGLQRIRQKTENNALRNKLKFNIIGLCLMMVTEFIFFTFIPIFLDVHYLKPIGYLLVTLGIIIMTYSFTRYSDQGDDYN